VGYLLKNGADPRLVNKEGWTSLHIAASSTGESYMHAMENSINGSAKIRVLEANFHEEGMKGFADGSSKNNRLARLPRSVDFTSV